jgi:hypothetical protein
MTKNKWIIYLSIVMLMALLVGPGTAQSDGLTIGMSRDFGYASGTGDIQGNFSIKVEGPENLANVVFLIDGEPIGEDSEAPFRLQFVTDNYPNGVHVISAVGYLSDGTQLTTKEIRANFVPAGEGMKVAGAIIGVTLTLVVGAFVLSFVLTMASTRKKGALPLGTPRNYGIKGGTICTKCGRPFSLNLLSFNLVTGVYDFCPHCGKWQFVRRLPIDVLRQAEQNELTWGKPAEPIAEESEEEKLRKQLDASRYQ